MQDDLGLPDEKKINATPLQRAAFVRSISKRFMKIFILAIGGCYTIVVYYGDTDSF